MTDPVRALSLSIPGLTLEHFMWLNSKDEVSREFFDGVVVAMSPSPSRKHQQVVQGIFQEFAAYFRGKRCQPWIQRDVILQSRDKGDKHDTVVVPDLLVLCDPTKDDGQNIHGAPSFVLEVWSPSNTKQERARKHARYEEAGVIEIWEVILETGHLVIYHNEGCGYSTTVAELDDVVSSQEFDGLTVDFSEILLD